MNPRKEKGCQEELSLLTSNGEPLSKLGINLRARPAIEEEWLRYDAECKHAEEPEDIVFVYLVKLDP